VELRIAPVFAFTEKLTVPLPVPEAPDVIITQLSGAEAVQAQDTWLATATEPVVAVLSSMVEVVDKEYVQVKAACWIVKVWPAIVMNPVRAAPVFGAMLNATLPFPLPLLPCVMEMKELLVDAVQLHPLGADTVTPPIPPVEAKFALVGFME
jgi:hypothetical protein